MEAVPLARCFIRSSFMEEVLMKIPAHKLDVKIIALDLDDTLLTEDLTITPRTVGVLRKTATKGIYVVLASGRLENAMFSYVRTLSIAGLQQGRFLICLNGSSVHDLHLRQQIYSRVVPAEILRFVYREASARGLPVQVYDAGEIFVSFGNEWSERDKNLSKLKLSVVDDYENFLSRDFSKMVIPFEPEKLKQFEKFLKESLAGKAEIFTSKPYFLEVLPVNSGKGNALEWLCGELKIPQSQTMVFGDSFNDLSMIEYSAHGVAMCNGQPEILECADYVTRLDNNHDGIADFLEEFVL